jgi:hypothetical protein
MMMPLIKMKLVNQTYFLECLQGAVDGRETQTCTLLSGPAEDFVSVEMTLSLTNNLHDQGALIGNPHPGGIQPASDFQRSRFFHRSYR